MNLKIKFLLGGLFIFLAGFAGFVFFYKTDSPDTGFVQGEFGGVSLNIELATTTEARMRGLGERSDISDDYGMLFVFPKEEKHGFWMKDTLVSIDIFWLDSEGRVVSRQEQVSPKTYPDVFYPSEPVRFVLETTAGFGARHHIATGTPLLLKNWMIVSN